MRARLIPAWVVTTVVGPVVVFAELGGTESFRDAVTVPNIRAHQQALQAIADANGGTRVAGTPGYDASGQYVANLLEAHGYTVTEQQFSFTAFVENSLPALEQVAPVATSYTANDPAGFFTLSWSGTGDVTAAVTAVDLMLPPGPVSSSTSGCEAADFSGFPVGNIALIQRGTCTFRQKVENAQAAGAVGVIFFNEGQPGRTDAGSFTLSEPQVAIPAVFTSFAIGEELAGLAELEMRLRVDVSAAERTTFNLLAERPGCDESVVMLGAHLDSVSEGPGINDNGSGAATLLELAIQLAEQGLAPQRTIRFAWWGAEELGLLGSEFYVGNLSPTERARIQVYLNFDMVGSPNYVRFVYDGDGSSGGELFPPGSDAIEDIFRDYFDELGLPVEELALTRSDNFPFAQAGIPVGGLFTGAEGIKTPEQAAVYGGTAGQQYDPCYHLACDTFDNTSLTALDQMSDAAAHALLTLAFDPSLCTRVSASQKGSLLMYSKVELRWLQGGALRQDTILELTNDYPDDVCVQLYFVNGDRPLNPVRDPVTGGLIVEGEPGWEWVDCQICLTPDQTTYWSAATGLPAGCQPFTVLDPSTGMGPGRPDPFTPGERHLRGFVYAWAVDQQGYAIHWNHLSGGATIVNYLNSDAWDYNAWAFQAHQNCVDVCSDPPRGECENPMMQCVDAVHGERVGEPGRIRLDGRQYDAGFDMLLMDFFGSGSTTLSGGGATVTSDTDLTLHPITADLRQDSIGPVTTKAEFAVWNEEERRFSGTTRCITCWDQTLLSLYGGFNHFLVGNLQSDKGKARIDGVRSDDCDVNCVRQRPSERSLDIDFILDILGIDHVCSYDASLLGVVAKHLAFSGPSGHRAHAGRTLVGMDTEAGWIKWDIIAPPGTATDEPVGLRSDRKAVKLSTGRRQPSGQAQPVEPMDMPGD